MSTGTATPATPRTPDLNHGDVHVRRYSNETKPAYKTTEFLVYVAITIALLVAALVTRPATATTTGWPPRRPGSTSPSSPSATC